MESSQKQVGEEVTQKKIAVNMSSLLVNGLLPNNNIMERTAFKELTQPDKRQLLQNQACGSHSEGSPCEQDVYKVGERCAISSSGDLQNKLRKQIKHYLFSIYGSQQENTNKHTEQVVQTLFDLIRGDCGEQAPHQPPYNRKNLNYYGSKHSMPNVYNSLKQTNRLRIIIIDPVKEQAIPNSSTLRLTVTDRNGNIQLYRHRIHKSSDLAICLGKIQRKCSSLVVAVRRLEEQREWKLNLGKKLKIWLRGYEMKDDQCVGAASARYTFYLPITNQQDQQFKTYNKFRQQDYNQVLSKYDLIKNFLDLNASKLANQVEELYLAFLFPFAYNLISHLVSSEPSEIKLQLKPLLGELQSFLKEVGREQQGKKSQNRDGHYPISLKNAQLCWRCKTRGFISCSTCSFQQGKTISLCLQCYSVHHQKMIEVTQNDLIKNVLVRWQDIDGEVEMIMDEERFNSMPSVGGAKKQQTQ